MSALTYPVAALPRRVLPRPGAALLVVAVTVAGIAGAAQVAAATGVTWAPGGDLAVYRQAAVALLAGESPYQVSLDGYGFVYPPVAAWLATPLALVAPGPGYWVVTVLSALTVPLVVGLLVDHLAPGTPRRGTLVALGSLAVLPLSPVAGTLLLGNVNLLLLALVLVDLLGPTGRSRGLLIGVAAGIKLTPLILLGYLLLTGRIRAGLTALVAFGGTVALGFLVLPGDSARFWGSLVLDSSRTRPPGEEAHGTSLRGAVLHLLPEAARGAWVPVTLLVGAVGLGIAVRAARRGAPLTGLLACAVTGLLVSPVTWYAHWVWGVPLLALLVAGTGHRTARIALPGLLWLVLALPLPWWVGYRLGWSAHSEQLWMRPVEVLLTLTGLALLPLFVLLTRRPGSPARPASNPTGGSA